MGKKKKSEMSKVVLYIATSIDGFIARPNGKLDWLENLPTTENTDYGYADFLKSVGTIVMGKTTYNEILGFGIDWPYPDHKTYVVSSNQSFLPTTPETFLLNTDIDVFITKLKEESDQNCWLVGGGKLINYFLNKDLIDKMIVSIAPVILGEGIPLFAGKSMESEWNLDTIEKFDNCIVSLTYTKK